MINLAEIIVLLLIAGAVWLVLQGLMSASLLLGSLAALALLVLRMMRRPVGA
jgi:multisubunit Na+/H+ antiporter MnhE subunit